MGRRFWKGSQDMKYNENNSQKRRTAKKRKLSEEHEEKAQN